MLHFSRICSFNLCEPNLSVSLIDGSIWFMFHYFNWINNIIPRFLCRFSFPSVTTENKPNQLHDSNVPRVLYCIYASGMLAGQELYDWKGFFFFWRGFRWQTLPFVGKGKHWCVAVRKSSRPRGKVHGHIILRAAKKCHFLNRLF